MTDLAYYGLLVFGGTGIVLGGAQLIEALASAPKAPPMPAPTPAPESLDQALARLKAKAGGDIIDPALMSALTAARNPQAFQPTAESEALARQFQAHERRLKRIRAVKAWFAARTSRLTSTYRSVIRWVGIWN